MERRFTLGHILKLAKRIGEQYDTAVTARAAAFGLGKPEADVVLFLSNNPGKDTARDLTEYRGFSKSYVSKALEPLRAEGKIGAALEAEIALHCSVADQNWLSPLVDELRFLLISGDVRLVPDADAKTIAVSAQPTQKHKCVRCWHHREDVGAHAAHPLLCGRCVSNVDGAGEVRKWF